MKTFDDYVKLISQLPEDVEKWKYLNGVKISEKVIENALEVFTELKDFYDIVCEIYPTVIGTLCITWKTKKWYISAEFFSDMLDYYKEEIVPFFSERTGEYIDNIIKYEHIGDFINLFKDIRE